jgi:hypothetical protein
MQRRIEMLPRLVMDPAVSHFLGISSRQDWVCLHRADTERLVLGTLATHLPFIKLPPRRTHFNG